MSNPTDLSRYPDEFFKLFDKAKAEGTVLVVCETTQELIAFRSRWNTFVSIIKSDYRHPDNTFARRMTTKVGPMGISLMVMCGKSVGGNYVFKGLTEALGAGEPGSASGVPPEETPIEPTKLKETLSDVLGDIYGQAQDGEKT